MAIFQIGAPPQGNLEAKQFETLTTNDTPVGCTATKYRVVNTSVAETRVEVAKCAIFTQRTNAINFTVDGTASDATVGHNLAAGDQLILYGIGLIKKFSAHQVSGAGTCDVTYLF